MASYSEWKPCPRDLAGLTIRTDHADGQLDQESFDPIVGGTAGAANLGALLSKAQTALANNQAFLAIGSPTNAQAVAQVQALTRQVDAIIYYLLHPIVGLNSIPGT